MYLGHGSKLKKGVIMMEKLKIIPPKITLLLDSLNHKFLNAKAKEFEENPEEKFSYGKFVNKCIDFQRMLTPEIRFETAEAYKVRIHELRKLRDKESYDKHTYYNQIISQYVELYKILSIDEDLDLSVPTRSWYKIKNGHTILPKNWIQLEAFGSLADHENVLVVECREGYKHGNVPHFFLASDCRYGCDVTDELEEAIYSEIAKVYEPFSELRRRDVDANKLPDLHANTEQLEAWAKEPHFGIFVVPHEGDDGYYNYSTGKYKYPAGAYVAID